MYFANFTWLQGEVRGRDLYPGDIVLGVVRAGESIEGMEDGVKFLLGDFVATEDVDHAQIGDARSFDHGGILDFRMHPPQVLHGGFRVPVCFGSLRVDLS